MRDLITISLLVILTGCTPAPPTGAASSNGLWSGSENALTRIRVANGIRTSVTLVPPEQVAELEGDTWAPDTSAEQTATAAYAKQLYFVVNLATNDTSRKTDVMFNGVRDVTSFKEQAYDLNFGWDQRVKLRCGSHTYTPRLSTLENTYSLTKDRNIIIVFTPDGSDDADFFSSETIELEITNEIFRTGTQRFKFIRADLEKTRS